VRIVACKAGVLSAGGLHLAAFAAEIATLALTGNLNRAEKAAAQDM
jgi:hypothetical protein